MVRKCGWGWNNRVWGVSWNYDANDFSLCLERGQCSLVSDFVREKDFGEEAAESDFIKLSCWLCCWLSVPVLNGSINHRLYHIIRFGLHQVQFIFVWCHCESPLSSMTVQHVLCRMTLSVPNKKLLKSLSLLSKNLQKISI